METRFIVGARFYCRICATRGVDQTCRCETPSTSHVDLTSPEARRDLDALIANRISLGAPSKSELFGDGMRSKLQWVASVVIAIPWFLHLYTDRRIPTFTQGVAVLFVFVLFLFLVRLMVFVAALLLRVALSVALLLAAAIVGIVEAVRSPRDPRAPMLLDRAEAVLSGIYFAPAPIALRTPADATESVTLVLRDDLVVLWSIGERGRLTLLDAEVPSFEATSANGETIAVTVEAGAIELDVARSELAEVEASSPLFGETRRSRLARGTPLRVAGGAWVDLTSEVTEGAGFREAPVRKRLIGSAASPLEIRSE